MTETTAPDAGKMSAEEMAYGFTGLEATVEQAEPTAPAKARRTVRFVESERERVVPLAHALECEGVVYERITVRRLTVSDFVEHFAKPDDARGRFPCFFDDRGDAVPDEVLDALSLEDSVEVNGAYQHFLPTSFRADPAS